MQNFHKGLKRSVSGFSLVEISFVLGIVSILISTIVFTTKARLDATRIYTTKERMAIILKSLENYVENYGHIPCPSIINNSRTNVNYGWGTGTNQTSADCPNAITQFDDGSNDIVKGMVPFKTLNPPLEPSLVIDGWGNRYTYIVTELYTNTSGFGSTVDTNGDSEICIHSSCANDIIEDDQLAFILLSHGPNGHGAYRENSADGASAFTISSPYADDTENIDSDKRFVMKMPQSDYDDILLFRTKWQLPTYINQ